MKPVALLAIAGALAAAPAFAAQPQCDPKFDLDGDGYVRVGMELDVCVLHGTSSIHKKFDKNLNGLIDPSEASAMESAARDDSLFVAQVEDAKAILTGTPGMRVEKQTPAAAVRGTGTPPVFDVQTGFLVRKAYSPIGVFSQLRTPLAKVSGADFAILNDFLGENTIATASGAVEAYRTWVFNPASSDADVLPTGIVEAAVHGGIEFNRKLDAKTPARNINSLTFRGGAEAGIQGSGTLFHFVRANVFDATDFDFDAHVVGGEMEWEPVYLPFAIGVARPIPGLPVYFRWRPVLHAEYQNVVDAGGSGKLVQGASYLLAGPAITAELWFAGWLNRLSLNATYWAMGDLSGAGGAFQYLEAAANWGLDEAGHVALTAKYRNGTIPKSREMVNDLMLGVSTKF